jgi:PGF-pre-PGF domain-containing protein
MKIVRFLLPVIILIVIILAIFFKPQITGLATDPIDNNEAGLMAVWHLNEGSGSTFSDSSGHGNTGAINGATWIDGKFNKALQFDGVNDYLEIPNSASLNITGNVTISLWIKLGTQSSSDEKMILSKGWENTNTRSYNLITTYGALGAMFNICNAAQSCAYPDFSWENNNWHHLVGTYNGSIAKIYVDGVEENSDSLTGLIQSTIRPVQIGGWFIYGSGSGYLNGTLDEIAIYNRVLSASEVQTQYNKGMSGGAGNPTASTTASPTSGTSPLSVSFTCSGSGGTSPYTYSWTFGDSGTSSSQNLSHTYSAGTFTSTCTVTDSASKTGTSSKTITVTGADITAPTVSVSHSPSSPTTTDSVTLTATASDNVGVTGINIYVDGASKKTCTSSPCSTTAQTYSLGNHTYYATASDAAGNSGRDPASGTKSFTVSSVAQQPVCGNNVKETGEDCDGSDSSACPGLCTTGCTCAAAGGTYNDFTLNTQPSSITDSKTGNVVTITTDEYSLVVDWSQSNFVDYKIKPKFTTNFIRYRRMYNPSGTGFWGGTVDENGNNLDGINMVVSSWGRSGNKAWFYESSSEFSLNQSFIFYKDYIELDVHYKPGTKKVETRYFVGFFDASNNNIATNSGSDPTIYMPGEAETMPGKTMCDYGMGGWYPLLNEFAPAVDWRVPSSDIAVEWGYNGFPTFLYTPVWNAGYGNAGGCNVFELEYTSTDSVVPHPASGKEQDFHMFIRPYQANDGQRRGTDYGYAQWIGPKLAANYQHHSTSIFPLTAFGWGEDAFKTYAENSQIKLAVYSSNSNQINFGYLSAQYGHSDIAPTVSNTPTDWHLWEQGVGIPQIGTNGWVVLNPVVPAVRHHFLYDLPSGDLSWLRGLKSVYWDEINPDSISNQPRNDYHYWNDYILQGYLQLIQDTYDAGYWSYVFVNPWVPNMHVCYVADLCMAEGYLSFNYQWSSPYNLPFMYSAMKFINQMPQQYKPRLLVRQEFDSAFQHDVKTAYRTIFGSAKYGFHITLDTYQPDNMKIHFQQAAENMYIAMGCSRNDDSCITDNSKRNQIATLFLEDDEISDTTRTDLSPTTSKSLTTNARMVVFAGDQYWPDITFTAAKSAYTFTNLRNTTTSIKITIPVTNDYVSNSSDIIIDSSTVQGSNRVIQARILTEKTASIISTGGQPSCTESWTCGTWSSCVSGTQTRTCTDANACGTTNSKPATSQSCQSCIESWSCNAWSSCVGGAQTRSCTDSNSCGTTNDKPATSQSCQSCVESWLCTAWSICNNGLQTRSCTDSNACGTTTLKPQVSQTCCMEDWTCGGWSSCVGGAQSRTCTDRNSCGTTGQKPVVSQSCVCTESWTCGTWSSCVNNLQTRTCTDSNSCGTTSQKPNITQTCTAPTCTEDWACTDWSDCLGGTETRNCIDNNKCGTTSLKPKESESCVMPPSPTPNETTPIVSAEQPSVGPSGTMGGTSFGGSMGSGVIRATTPINRALKYQFENLPVYEVGLTTLVDVTGAKVSIEDLGNIKPQIMNLIPDGIIYRYVNLETTNIQKDQTQNITIKFKVLQSFFRSNSIDPRVTRLQRWDGSKWNKLDTTPTGSDTTYYYFSASPQSLSIFAITAEITGLLPPSTTCDKFCGENEALNVDNCQCVSVKAGVFTIPWSELLNSKNLPYTIVAVVVLGIIILFIFLRRR